MRFTSLVSTLGLAAFTIVSFVACGGAASEEPTETPATDDGEAEEIKAAVIDESDDGKTIPISLGRSFTVAVSDNASTGYVWSVQSVDRTLGQPKITQIAGDASHPGAAGLKKFTWSTKSPLDLVGKHTIVLLHARASGNSPSTTLTVTVDIKGTATAATCGGIIGKTCGADAYCDFAASTHCGAGDQMGKCEAKPQFCPAVILPVCGCNGKTFNNSCEANRADVSVISSGKCAK